MIEIRDDNGKLIEYFRDADHMYDVLNSRYKALQVKRELDLLKAHHRGFMKGFLFGVLVGIGPQIAALIIDKF